MARLYNAGLRIGRHIAKTVSKVTPRDAKTKAAIRTYSVAVSTEEVVRVQVSCLRSKIDSKDEDGLSRIVFHSNLKMYILLFPASPAPIPFPTELKQYKKEATKKLGMEFKNLESETEEVGLLTLFDYWDY